MKYPEFELNARHSVFHKYHEPVIVKNYSLWWRAEAAARGQEMIFISDKKRFECVGNFVVLLFFLFLGIFFFSMGGLENYEIVKFKPSHPARRGCMKFIRFLGFLVRSLSFGGLGFDSFFISTIRQPRYTSK